MSRNEVTAKGAHRLAHKRAAAIVVLVPAPTPRSVRTPGGPIWASGHDHSQLRRDNTREEIPHASKRTDSKGRSQLAHKRNGAKKGQNRRSISMINGSKG
jgi:hypothetical protein